MINARVDLRRGAGNNYDAIRTLNNGTDVVLLRQSGTWVQVRVGNDEGWVREHFVDSTTAGTFNIESPLRSGPGNRYNQIRRIPSGVNVTILRQRGTWLNIRVEGQTGWVNHLYITPRPLEGLANVRNTTSSAIHTIDVTSESGLRVIIPQRRTIGAGNAFALMEGVRIEHVAPNGHVTEIPLTSNQWGGDWQFSHDNRVFHLEMDGMMDNLTPGVYERRLIVRRGNTEVGRSPHQRIVVR